MTLQTDITGSASGKKNPQGNFTSYGDELPYFYSQDSDVMFQIDSSKKHGEWHDTQSEGEVFDFDRISAAEGFDFLFSEGEEDSDLAFARNPFGGIESRDVFFQDDEEFNEDIKSVGADSLTSFINKRAFQNTEKLEFSDPTLKTEGKCDLSVVENFMAVRPEMFLFNFNAPNYASPTSEANEVTSSESPWAEVDGRKGEGEKASDAKSKNDEITSENTSSKSKKKTLDNFTSNDEKLDELCEVQDYSNGFFFSHFAGEGSDVQELFPDIIVQDGDGVFKIDENVAVPEEGQNSALKELVAEVFH